MLANISDIPRPWNVEVKTCIHFREILLFAILDKHPRAQAALWAIDPWLGSGWAKRRKHDPWRNVRHFYRAQNKQNMGLPPKQRKEILLNCIYVILLDQLRCVEVDNMRPLWCNNGRSIWHQFKNKKCSGSPIITICLVLLDSMSPDNEIPVQSKHYCIAGMFS